jgi:ElaB/YqjD/DUF883 family membrane-anchored ribosome-binding protein
MDDAEALVKATDDESLKVVKDRVSQARDVAVNRARTEVDAADLYVHENPWRAIGVAAGVGFLFGALVSRRS